MKTTLHPFVENDCVRILDTSSSRHNFPSGIGKSFIIMKVAPPFYYLRGSVPSKGISLLAFMSDVESSSECHSDCESHHKLCPNDPDGCIWNDEFCVSACSTFRKDMTCHEHKQCTWDSLSMSCRTASHQETLLGQILTKPAENLLLSVRTVLSSWLLWFLTDIFMPGFGFGPPSIPSFIPVWLFKWWRQVAESYDSLEAYQLVCTQHTTLGIDSDDSNEDASEGTQD